MSADEPASEHTRPHIRAVKRDSEKVRFLELFFDLVFVLGFTQCTALIVEHPTWTGMLQGIFVLGLLWWSWGAYAWLTSVVDPEEGMVRLVMFAAMATVLVMALAAPKAFGDRALTFAIAYSLVMLAHLMLFVLASKDEPNLRQSVITLAVSSTIAMGLLVGASFLDDTTPQLIVWGVAIVVNFGGPLLFGVEGWRLSPSHFAERHGLIIILALGESIVVLGVGAQGDLTAGVIVATVLGVALSSALWWTYFDVVAIVTEQRLLAAAPGREQNALAQHSYSYLHLPMVAGIILVAVGLENTVAHVDEPLHTVPAYALTGGVALYLLAHVALRLRNAHTVSYSRLIVAAAILLLTPVATEIPSLTTLAALTVIVWSMIAVETKSYGEARAHVRHHH